VASSIVIKAEYARARFPQPHVPQFIQEIWIVGEGECVLADQLQQGGRESADAGGAERELLHRETRALQPLSEMNGLIGIHARNSGRALACAVLAMALLAVASAADVSASNTIRPRPEAPDPRVMVLKSGDLGRARVTAQKYFRDTDFPSVISYEREFEYGKSGSTPLPYVDSQAEVGTSAVTTARFLSTIRAYFGSKEARRLIAESLLDEIGSDSLVSNVQVGRPRNLGVGGASFDVLVTTRVLGLRTDFHIAVFRVERVLGLVDAVGEPGSRIPLSVMTRLARIMASRMTLELAPRNTSLPTISGGPSPGDTLTAAPGSWAGSPTTVTDQWQRCDAAGAGCADIAGAAGPTYVVAEGDLGLTLRVVVSARNTVASASAASAPTSVVAYPYRDSFDQALGPIWHTSGSGSGATLAAVNSRLEVSIRADAANGPPGGWIGAPVGTNCQLHGDFDVQVDYELLVWPAANGVAAFMNTYYGPGPAFESITRQSMPWGESYDARIDRVSSSALTNDGGGSLRLTRTGQVLTASARSSGGSWHIVATRRAVTDPATITVGAATNDDVFGDRDVKVGFDNFSVNSGSLRCP
jgi:hypothetical protein